MRHFPEGGGGNFGQDPEGSTSSVDLDGDPNTSGYIIFDPGGMYTINWRTLDQESDPKRLKKVKQIKVQRES